MGDENVSKAVKSTQEQLGRFVKKPPLTEKNLSRPPFRFLHDIVKNIIDTTGFMSDVFTPEELDASNVTTRDAKTAFMQKLIQAIKDKTGEDVPIKISKVLAGLEAEKTNGLLQALARAIDAHNQDGGGGGGSSQTAKKSTKKLGATKAGATGSKAGQQSKQDASKKARPGDKKDGPAGTKRTNRDPSPGSGGKPAAKQGKSNDAPQPGSGTKKPGSKTKLQAPPPEVDATLQAEANVPESAVNDETLDAPPEATKASAVPPLTRKESSADLSKRLESAKPGPEEQNQNEVDVDNTGGAATPTTLSGHVDNDDNNNNNSQNGDINANENDQLEIYDNFAASVVKPNMQTLPPPKTPILTDADAVTATMAAELIPKPSSLTPTPGPSLTPSPVTQVASAQRPPTGTGSRTLSREASATEQKGSPLGPASIGEVRPPTGQATPLQAGQQVRSRPDTGTAANRMSSARPPSARRAPPRPKSSVVKEDAEPYRPTTGKVAHVILDNVEDPDDDNYVVREMAISASKPPGLSDLDETPELTMGGGGGAGILGGGDLDNILPADQRGLLVNQILETQKELEDKKGGSEDTPVIEQKLRELSLSEVEKLKNLIQVCARSANPLAKLLDYMAEDVDAMQKEYNNFKEESKKLSLELEKGKVETDKFLQSLKHELTEVERKIKDKEDAILASQMKILQQEERIEEIVNGFERVRSGKSAAAAKEHMPEADEILAHIQGQTSSLMGGGGGGGGFASVGVVGGPISSFSFSAVGSSPPSSVTSAVGPKDPFRIPDSFMANPAVGARGSVTGETGSPFSRGRMWSSMANNNNNSATFDMGRNSIDDENEEPSMPMASIGMKRNTGRSGGGVVGTGGSNFKRGMTTANEFQMDQGGSAMEVDNFNPWT